MNKNIIFAAQLIAEIDPALSRAFLDNRFQRHNLVTAFHRGLQGTKWESMSDKIAMLCRSAIDSTQEVSA